MAMNLKSLEVLLSIDRLGGFKAAAESLRLTQPAISIRIAQLEHELGAKLFYRTGNQVSPTPIGKTLIYYAERILELHDEAVATIKGHSEKNGILRLGTIETVVHTWLPHLLSRIGVKYPNITIDLDIGNSDDIQRKVTKGMLDLGIFIGPVNSPVMIETSVYKFKLGLVASKKFKDARLEEIGLGNLPSLSLMTFSRNTVPHSMLCSLLAREGISRHRIHAMSSAPMIVNMLLKRPGLALIPQAVVRNHLESGELCLLDVGMPVPKVNCVAGRLIRHNSEIIEDVVKIARQVAIDEFGESG
ncbi:LysR family transcriptional regulator [Gluconacetobacter diazotrophicus]|nr:LysR family transcriptional regulator [Gluconacetobacter diazotrophicus]